MRVVFVALVALASVATAQVRWLVEMHCLGGVPSGGRSSKASSGRPHVPRGIKHT